MNYIHRLEDEVAALRAELMGLRSGLQDLKGYLVSEKFHVDPTVQVRDMLTRLEAAEHLAGDLRPDQETANKRRRAGKEG